MELASTSDWVREIDWQAWDARVGSAAWVVHAGRIRERVAAFARFTRGASGVLYPVKANPSSALLSLLATEGAGADCATRYEIRLALWAGIPVERILYNSPVPDLDVARWLLALGGHVVIDDPRDLRRLDEDVRSNPEMVVGRVYVRLNPDLPLRYAQDAAYQTLTAHAARTGRFGLPSETLAEAVSGLALRISGLHVHVGTQMDHLEAFAATLSHLHDVADELRALGHPVSHIDLGGGLGIPFSEDAQFPSVDAFTDRLSALRRPEFTYAVEPGHALIGDAVVLLTRLLRLKTVRGKRWGIASVGTDRLAKVTLLDWRHRVHCAKGPLPSTGEDALAGPLCFAGDVLLPNTDLSGLEEGALLAVRDVGAYCAALNNHFNGRHDPPTWWLGPNDEACCVQREEPWFLDPVVAQATFKQRTTEPKQPRDVAEFQRLSSRYLREQAATDTYELQRVEQTGERSFVFTFNLSAEVPFVSGPFALRVAGDATIQAVLAVSGLEEKDRPVWGRTVVMDLRRPLEPTDGVAVRIDVSAAEQRADGRQSLLVRYDMGSGAIDGCMHIVF